MELFDLAIKYQKDYYNAYFNKGCMLIELGEYIEAIKIFGKCKELKGDEKGSLRECNRKIRECTKKMSEKGQEVEIKYVDKNEEEEKEDEEQEQKD